MFQRQGGAAVVSAPAQQVQTMETNKVIRNTYMLLSMTLLFSTLTAGVAIMSNAAPLHWLLSLGGSLLLLFGVMWTRNSAMALPMVFAFTGFFGYTLGPTINLYLSLPHGSETVMTAMGLTAGIFLSLSAYALTTKKDFSFLSGFLFAGLMVIIIASLVGIFVEISGLQLMISSAAVLIFSGYILYDTSAIVRGGQTNYVMATVSLYLDIVNLFMNLLYLVQALSGDD
ncbi:MAG: Bax inhibitor-1/YccA family protein [Hahellaceae bacterium]|nr:Bax inhibitor-1/YccA family protein [Hahellaceae bacterium]